MDYLRKTFELIVVISTKHHILNQSVSRKAR